MANLRDIKLSITELSWEEQLKIHKQVRESRTTYKIKPKAVKKRRSTVQKSISQMSLEELEMLSEQLETLINEK